MHLYISQNQELIRAMEICIILHLIVHLYLKEDINSYLDRNKYGLKEQSKYDNSHSNGYTKICFSKSADYKNMDQFDEEIYQKLEGKFYMFIKTTYAGKGVERVLRNTSQEILDKIFAEVINLLKQRRLKII